MFLTAAPDVVRVPTNYCVEGNAFTIRVPVRIPAGASGEYVWYKNGIVIAGTRATLTAGVTTITYTIPANEAFGESTYYFIYSLKDDCDDCNEWTESTKYVLTFTANAECLVSSVGSIDGSITYCSAVSGGTIMGGSADFCDVSDVGGIAGNSITYCSAVSGGTIMGGSADFCDVSDVGGIAGSGITYCSAVSGGAITGGDAEFCNVSDVGGIAGDGVTYCTATSG